MKGSNKYQTVSDNKYKTSNHLFERFSVWKLAIFSNQKEYCNGVAQHQKSIWELLSLSVTQTYSRQILHSFDYAGPDQARSCSLCKCVSYLHPGCQHPSDSRPAAPPGCPPVGDLSRRLFNVGRFWYHLFMACSSYISREYRISLKLSGRVIKTRIPLYFPVKEICRHESGNSTLTELRS